MSSNQSSGWAERAAGARITGPAAGEAGAVSVLRAIDGGLEGAGVDTPQPHKTMVAGNSNHVLRVKGSLFHIQHKIVGAFFDIKTDSTARNVRVLDWNRPCTAESVWV